MNDSETDVAKWQRFAEMDAIAARHLNETLYPKPLEIICFHCQQCAEKYLKSIIIQQGREIKKTHDLGSLIGILSDTLTIPNEIHTSCAKLTQYGVKTRYPQEFEISESHVVKALSDMEKVVAWCKSILQVKLS